MKRMDLAATKRLEIGKGVARSTRRAGRIPAVMYGGDKDPVALSVDFTEMVKALKTGGQSENVLVNITFEDEADPSLTLVRATQHNPLTGQLEHVDFYRVSTDKPITTTVALHTTGTPVGVRNGGILELVLREVEISCLPLNIPDYVEVDISNVDVGQSLHVSDLPTSDKYTILTAPERSIASVALPQSEISARQAAAPTEGAPAETAGE